MRDPNRITEVLSVVEEYWRRHPDLRLMQLISNFDMHYYTEDDKLVQLLNEGMATEYGD